MKFDAELIASLSRLSRLTLRTQESAVMADQLPAIVAYVGQLQKVQAIATPTDQGEVHPLRLDEVRKFTHRDEILDQAPDRQADFWRVPTVF